MQLADGIHIDKDMHIQVLESKLAQGIIREAQLEAAVQGLMAESATLKMQIPKDTEVKDDGRQASER